MQIIVENILKFLDNCVLFDQNLFQKARDALEKSTQPPTFSELHEVSSTNVIHSKVTPYGFPSRWLHIQQFVLTENTILKHKKK